MKTAISLALAIGLLSTAAHADNLYFQADGGISHYGSNSLNGSGFDIDQALTVAGRVGKPLSFVRVEAEASLTFGTVDLEADAARTTRAMPSLVAQSASTRMWVLSMPALVEASPIRRSAPRFSA